jgi:EmrB/QacA subfamily drug resistance transporter
MNQTLPPLPIEAALGPAGIRRIMVGVMLALLLGAMDQTIVAPGLPTIGRELADLEHLPWVVTAYLLSATAVTPLYGKLSDIHGRRTMLLVAVTIFIAGSVFCALAANLPMLILARFVQGLGGGGLIVLPQTIVGDLIAPRDRPRYQAYLAAVYMTSSILGPVFGGLFAEHLHWSLIFWINLPLGALALAMTWNELHRLPQNHRPHRLDVVGAILMILATTLLLLALSWGGRTYAWSSLEILTLLAGSGVAFALFAGRLMTASEPFIPLTVMLNPVVAAGVTASFFAVGAMVGLSIYLPIYFEAVRGLNAAQSGLYLMALMTGTVCGAIITGKVMGATPRYKRTPMAGLALSVVATATLAATANDLSLFWFVVLLAIMGVGIGTQFPVTTVGVQNAVQPHELGTATANLNFFRSLGSAVLVAAYGAILLGGIGDGAEHIATIDGLAAEAARNGKDLGTVFQVIFAAAALTLAIAFIGLAAMKELPLRGAAERPGTPAKQA